MGFAEIRMCHLRGGVLVFGAICLLAAIAACNSAVTPRDQTPTPPSGDDDNALVTDALSYQGTLTGKVYDSQSTRGSDGTTPAGQELPEGLELDEGVVLFHDLSGNELRGPDGQPIEPAPLGPDGSFEADDLPVGTDFAICVDLQEDGTCDFEGNVNVPSQDGGDVGELHDVRVDPLTTLIRAKLRRLMEERGIDPRDLPISPAAVVERIVDAYIHLFEEAGIEHEITIEDIASVSLDQLAELFDSIIPPNAQSGMRIVEGNLRLARAEDLEQRAIAIAEVFLRAGFPIADMPGGMDLSSLADLDGVSTATLEELFGGKDGPGEFDEPIESDGQLDAGSDGIDDGFLDGLDEELLEGVDEDLLLELADEYADEFDGGFPPTRPAEGIVVYVDTTAEPDRNFANAEGEQDSGEEGRPHLPLLREPVLLELTRLVEEGQMLTLGDLYEALTSLADGLGTRLTYMIFDPNFAGPPLNVFQTQDGQGKALNLARLFRRVFESGLQNLDPEEFDRRQEEFRQLLTDLLGDTVAPEFERLFGAILSDRIGGVDDLAARIREARVHLPFNRSGPSTFFVVADADSFDPDATASAVTVDALFDKDGYVESATYNPDGLGTYYLAFTHRTEEVGDVEFIVRETGWRLHARGGVVRASIRDGAVFQPVDGIPFADFVSETGAFYPGVSVAVVRSDFTPEPSGQDLPGPQERIFVLATEPGPDADPLRVDYDNESGQATFNPWGRHLLMFLPDSRETGYFALFNEDTGRPATVGDPSGFFVPPPERPDRFEDFFNEFPDGSDAAGVEDLGEFVEDFIEGLPPPADGDEVDPGDEGVADGVDDSPPDGGDSVTEPEDRQVDPAPPDGESSEEGDGLGEEALTGDDATSDGLPVGDDGTIPDEQLPPPSVGGAPAELILIHAAQIQGLPVETSTFTHVHGIEVPNERYDVAADPYYDDINDNNVHDADEPSAPFRPALFNPSDWRSTDIRLYYRRADNAQSITFEEVDFESQMPRTRDGVDLEPRWYKARLNAFRFGRPNTAINLLTAFTPPEFFDGTHSLNRDTRIDALTAVAIVNLAMDQVFNVEAEVDIDGLGPVRRHRMLVDANLFVVPIDDPFVVLIRSIGSRVEAGGP